MERLLQYIETREGRDRVIKVLERLALVGSTIVTTLLLIALYFKD